MLCINIISEEPVFLHDYILRTCQLWRYCQCYFKISTTLRAKHV